jgi:hypothetical protein
LQGAAIQPPHNTRSTPIYPEPFQVDGGRGKWYGMVALSQNGDHQINHYVNIHTCYKRIKQVCGKRQYCVHSHVEHERRDIYIYIYIYIYIEAGRSPSMKTTRPPHHSFDSLVNSTPLRSVPTNDAAPHSPPAEPVLLEGGRGGCLCPRTPGKHTQGASPPPPKVR